jgi:crotonobetaine/carnitine-CoA ligase
VWLAERMPRFMVPRYIEVVDDLPQTDTGKVKKAELRATGLNAATWDALA